MNSDEEKVDLFSAVDAFAVQTYLLENGWQEEEVVADRHVILSNNRNGRKYLIFLSLDKDVPDFPNRMLELFKTLEAFEQKQKSRILASFVNMKTF